MKDWFNRLDISLKTAFIGTIALLFIESAICFMFWIGLEDIPLGILLGGTVSNIFYLLIGLTRKKDQEKHKPIGSIVVLGLKFFITPILLFTVAWLYYEENIHIFNVFGVVGGYLIPLIVLFVFGLLRSK